MISINSNVVNNIKNMGAIAGMGALYFYTGGVVDLISSCCTHDPRRQDQLLKRGLRNLAIATAALVLSSVIQEWVRTKDQEVAEILSLFAKKDLAVLSGPFPQESIVCNIDALKSILDERGDPTSSALFSSFDCKNFLPWNEEFQEILGEYKAVKGIKPEHLSHSVMWAISPSKTPIISMARHALVDIEPSDLVVSFDQRALGVSQQIFTLIPEKNYFTVICDKLEEGRSHFNNGASTTSLVGVNEKLLQRDFIDLLFSVKCSELKDQYLSFVEKISLVARSLNQSLIA